MNAIVSFIIKRVNPQVLIAALDSMLIDLIAKVSKEDAIKAGRLMTIRHIVISILFLLTDANKDNLQQLDSFIRANDVMTDSEKDVVVSIVKNVFK